MGIDIGSKLMLVPVDMEPLYQAMKAITEEPLSGCKWVGEAADLAGIDYASPWYDSGDEHWDFGISLPSPTYEDLLDQESKWWDALNEAQTLLSHILGEGIETELKALNNVT
jgi:hypothetical protein